MIGSYKKRLGQRHTEQDHVKTQGGEEGHLHAKEKRPQTKPAMPTDTLILVS